MIKRTDKTKLKFLALLWLAVPLLIGLNSVWQAQAERTARERRTREARQVRQEQEELLSRMMQVAYGKGD